MNKEIATTRYYTLEEIDQKVYTRAGRELFERLPKETRAMAEPGRLIGLCSLLARNGNQAWRLSEEGCNGPANRDYFDGLIQREYAANGAGARHAELVAKAARNMEQWQSDHERRESLNEARICGLVALLNEITGQDWGLIPAGGGLTYALLIPQGLTGYRSDYSGNHGEPALFLGDK